MGSRRGDSGHMGRQRIDDLWFEYDGKKYLLIGWFDINPDRLEASDFIAELLKDKIYVFADSHGIFKQYWSLDIENLYVCSTSKTREIIEDEYKEGMYMWLGQKNEN